MIVLEVKSRTSVCQNKQHAAKEHEFIYRCIPYDAAPAGVLAPTPPSGPQCNKYLVLRFAFLVVHEPFGFLDKLTLQLWSFSAFVTHLVISLGSIHSLAL